VRGMGVEFILVDVDEYLDTDLLRKQCEALGLKYITLLGDQMVFKF
jgi:hypothetical protein